MSTVFRHRDLIAEAGEAATYEIGDVLLVFCHQDLLHILLSLLFRLQEPPLHCLQSYDFPFENDA